MPFVDTPCRRAGAAPRFSSRATREMARKRPRLRNTPVALLSTVSTPLHSQQYGSAGLGPIGSALKGFAMADWRTELDSLVNETMAFAKNLQVEPPIPRTIVEPNRVPALKGIESEGE